jgi:hypothetical protein
MFEGIALRAALRGIGGFLKSHWKGIVVAIALAIIATVVASHFGNDRHVRKERDGLVTWQNALLGAVRAEIPPERRAKLNASEAISEIQWLGRERRTLEQVLADQTKAVRLAEAKAADAQNNVKAALFRAAERDKAREATRQAILDPKRSTGLKSSEWGKL